MTGERRAGRPLDPAVSDEAIVAALLLVLGERAIRRGPASAGAPSGADGWRRTRLAALGLLPGGAARRRR